MQHDLALTFRITFEGFAPITVAAANRGKARIAAEKHIREAHDLPNSHSLVKATVESVDSTEISVRKVRQEFLPLVAVQQ